MDCLIRCKIRNIIYRQLGRRGDYFIHLSGKMGEYFLLAPNIYYPPLYIYVDRLEISKDELGYMYSVHCTVVKKKCWVSYFRKKHLRNFLRDRENRQKLRNFSFRGNLNFTKSSRKSQRKHAEYLTHAV